MSEDAGPTLGHKEGNKATSPILAILPKKSLRTASNVEGSLQCSDRRCHVNRCHRSCREGFFCRDRTNLPATAE